MRIWKNILGGAASATAVIVLMTLGGCARYYKVTDATTGTAYFTKNVDHKAGGAVRFRDQRTDNIVTLQSSNVEQIKEREYKLGVYSRE
jgi:hypothetical protein